MVGRRWLRGALGLVFIGLAAWAALSPPWAPLAGIVAAWCAAALLEPLDP